MIPLRNDAPGNGRDCHDRLPPHATQRPTSHAFRHFIDGYNRYTADYLGWKRVHKGRLLAAAAAESFDAMVSTDQRIADPQNLATLPIALLTLRTLSNRLEDLLALVGGLLDAPATPEPRSVVFVGPRSAG